MAEETPLERYPKRVRKPVLRDFADFSAVRNPKRWTPDQKALLESALRKYGDQDLALLASKVGTKTPNHVYAYLSTHKQAAAELTNLGRTERLDRLHRWVEHIKSKKQQNPLPNSAALSMLMIALMEDHPVPTDGEVNFSEAYKYMFQLLAGRHTERWQPDGAPSEPTLRFIKLSTLKLMKTTVRRMDRFKRKFSESSGAPDLFNKRDLDHLPGPVRRLVLHKHLNPLRLNEQATESEVLMRRHDDDLEASGSECIAEATATNLDT